MTDIDNMPAGPALDRLVAERVMGWFAVSDPALPYFQWHVAPRKGAGYSLPGYHDAFEPSTDIAHAWEVVERMAPREMRMGRTEAGRYYVNFDHQPMNAVADTAPLAICRAALKAMA